MLQTRSFCEHLKRLGRIPKICVLRMAVRRDGRFSDLARAPMLHCIRRRRSHLSDAPQTSFEKEGQMTSLKSITDKFDAWRRYREAVRELSSLSDRELADIGIRRGDIHFVVANALAA